MRQSADGVGGRYGRMMEWSTESRFHYILASATPPVLAVFAVFVSIGDTLARAVFLTLPLAAVSVVAQGWIWYPRVRSRDRLR